jgi:hypothetical protein
MDAATPQTLSLFKRMRRAFARASRWLIEEIRKGLSNAPMH